MKNALMIVGAGGHGRVTADMAALCGYRTIEFLDDAENQPIPLAGKVNDYEKFTDTHDFIVAVGDNAVRERLTNELIAGGAELASLIHPSAVIGSGIHIGKGTVILANSVVNTGTFIGNGVILNTACSVDHDCVIGDFAHVSVGAHLAGTVIIGKRTMIAAGATVINSLSVCDDCLIGAGTVVIRPISTPGTYVGVPARFLHG